MPETLADPILSTIDLEGRPAIWDASVEIDTDEINPDTLIAAHGLLIGALEGLIEDSEYAANWESLQIRMFHHRVGTRVAASVKSL